MATTKSKSFGAKLQRKGTTTTFEDIPQLIEVKPPQETCETLDVTTHDSTSGYREIVASFKSGGTCTASFMYDVSDTVHTALHTDYTGATKNSYKVVLPSGGEIAFDAYITEWAPDNLTIDGKVTVSITLTVTGAVTYSTGA